MEGAAHAIVHRADWTLCIVLMLISSVSSMDRLKVGRYDRQVSCHCEATDVIFTLEQQTEISCAVLCKGDVKCESFLYDKPNDSCIGCRTTNNETELDTTGDNQCWDELFTRDIPPPSDCLDVQKGDEAAADGVYTVTTRMGANVDVFCIMSKLGGGWTTMLRRYNGEVRFDRLFAEYDAGFGEKAGEHWLGLRYIHEMTSERLSDLHITTFGGMGLRLFPDKDAFEEWSNFSVGPGPVYALHIGPLANWKYGNVLKRAFHRSNLDT